MPRGRGEPKPRPALSRLDAAYRLDGLGYRLVVLHTVRRNGHCTCVLAEFCPSPGKHPRWAGWQTDLLSGADMRRWFGGPFAANVGVITGGTRPPYLCVLDVDGTEGRASLKEHPKMPPGPRVVTPSGGLHFYYQSPEPLPGSVRFEDGLDTRCVGNLVVAPNSIGVMEVTFDPRTISFYRWVSHLCRLRDLPAVPDWVAEGSQPGPTVSTPSVSRATRRTRTSARDGWEAADWNLRASTPLDLAWLWLECDAGELAEMEPDSGRNIRLYQLGFKWIATALVHPDLDPDEVIEVLSEAAAESGLFAFEIPRTIASAEADAIEFTEEL
jgi:hypothetical protein